MRLKGNIDKVWRNGLAYKMHGALLSQYFGLLKSCMTAALNIQNNGKLMRVLTG